MKLASVFAATSILGLVLVATPAHADGYVAPTIGVTFGADAGNTLFGATDRSKLSYGVATGYMSKGIFGVEEDFAYNRNFFGSNTRVLTLMTNAIIGIPIGGQTGAGIRPFASVGIGLINRNIDSPSPFPSFSSNSVGYDVGVGVMGYFADHVGLRVGVQYFRSFDRTESNTIGLEVGNFDFYRGAAGVLFRF